MWPPPSRTFLQTQASYNNKRLQLPKLSIELGSDKRHLLTDDHGAALGTKSSGDSLGEGVNALEHTLAGIVTKDDVLGAEVAAGNGLDEARGAGEGGAGTGEHFPF